MKDNYKEDLLVTYSWLVLLALLMGGRIVFGLANWGVWNDNLLDWFLFWQKPGFSYWGGAGGTLLMTVWFCKENGFKVWSFLEDINGIFYLLWVFLLTEELSKTGIDIKVLINIVVALFGFILSSIIAGKYRSFIWYKSGKKGFVFFFVSLVIGLVMSIVSLFYKDSIIVVSTYLLLSLISLSGLFILGEVFNNILINMRRNTNGNKK